MKYNIQISQEKEKFEPMYYRIVAWRLFIYELIEFIVVSVNQ